MSEKGYRLQTIAHLAFRRSSKKTQLLGESVAILLQKGLCLSSGAGLAGLWKHVKTTCGVAPASDLSSWIQAYLEGCLIVSWRTHSCQAGEQKDWRLLYCRKNKHWYTLVTKMQLSRPVAVRHGPSSSPPHAQLTLQCLEKKKKKHQTPLPPARNLWTEPAWPKQRFRRCQPKWFTWSFRMPIRWMKLEARFQVSPI